MKSLVAIGCLLASCVPADPGATVSAKLSVAGEGRLAVHHYTLRLYDRDQQLKGTYRSFWQLATIKQVASGSYFLKADAYQSWDDSVSLAQEGTATSTNWVTVIGNQVHYSHGDALEASLRLRDLMVHLQVHPGGLPPITVLPH